MSRQSRVLHFSIDRHEHPYTYAHVHVRADFVHHLYHHVMARQQQKHRSMGFSQGNAPRKYIEQAYHSHVIKHLKEFLFNYCVADFLLEQLRSCGYVLAEKPTPEEISIDTQEGALYTFRLYESKPQTRSDWKRTNITQPGRKRYKDIDRQVHEFLSHEVREHSAHDGIRIGDWVLFKVHIINGQDTLPLATHLWLRLGSEETDRSAHDLFLGHRPGCCFQSSHPFLEQYLSEQIDTEYPLGIEIVERVPGDTFSLHLFRHHFHLHTQEQTQQTLTQVFSYRNDISQRREIIEKTFKHMCKYFHVALNEYLIEQQRKHVLEDLYENPDYHVYKAQADFEEKVYLLAKKQLKETIIIDYICAQEHIKVTHKDIRAYINLMLRPRTKSFIYFTLPRTQISGQETPISYETVRQACLREKTLNYIIRTIFG